MIALLTKYLLQYKKVCIPHIGTFELVQQAPQLEVADKMLTAPGVVTRFTGAGEVTEHQVRFFAASHSSDGNHQQHDLSAFGESLKERIHRDPFRWNGFGILRFAANEIVFEPQKTSLLLQAVPAMKVMRGNEHHSMRVGDQQMTKKQVTDALRRDKPTMSPMVIAGWILLVLAIAAIILLLYVNKFQLSGTGLRQKTAAYFSSAHRVFS